MIFFFNDTATTEIYTLSLHDALPICAAGRQRRRGRRRAPGARLRGDRCLPAAAVRDERGPGRAPALLRGDRRRSEEHTSELQSRQYLVCRLLLDKKNLLVADRYYVRS